MTFLAACLEVDIPNNTEEKYLLYLSCLSIYIYIYIYTIQGIRLLCNSKVCSVLRPINTEQDITHLQFAAARSVFRRRAVCFLRFCRISMFVNAILLT